MSGRLTCDTDINFVDLTEYRSLQNKYKLQNYDSPNKIKYKFWNYFNENMKYL